MIDVVHLLTSSSKTRVISLIERSTSPNELASSLNMTRQAVDRHLKDLTRFGIVERIWVTGSRKPKVEYRLTDLGRSFYKDLQAFMINFRETGLLEFHERLRNIDMQLVNGEIDKRRYVELRSDLESEKDWFLSKGSE